MPFPFCFNARYIRDALIQIYFGPLLIFLRAVLRHVILPYII